MHNIVPTHLVLVNNFTFVLKILKSYNPCRNRIRGSEYTRPVPRRGGWEQVPQVQRLQRGRRRQVAQLLGTGTPRDLRRDPAADPPPAGRQVQELQRQLYISGIFNAKKS